MAMAAKASGVSLGRSPYGERGLKFQQERRRTFRGESLSLRRAWIEIMPFRQRRTGRAVALLTESVD